MAKRFCRRAHTLQVCAPARGSLGRNPCIKRQGSVIRARGGFLKNESSSTHMRGAAAPVSSGMRLSQRRGTWLPAQQPSSSRNACAFLRIFSGRWQALQKPLQARMSAHFGSHSVVCNRRKLRSTIPERLPRVRIATRRVNREDEAKRM
jgi:hypothetical protein